MTTVTKKDLARSVAAAIDCTNNLTLEMVDSLFEAMRETLIRGERIEIRGFGVLEVKDTKPKPAARNPRTGEIVYVPARRKTHFKPGKQLKEALHKTTPAEPAEPTPSPAESAPAPEEPAPPAAPSPPPPQSPESGSAEI